MCVYFDECVRFTAMDECTVCVYVVLESSHVLNDDSTCCERLSLPVMNDRCAGYSVYLVLSAYVVNT